MHTSIGSGRDSILCITLVLSGHLQLIFTAGMYIIAQTLCGRHVYLWSTDRILTEMRPILCHLCSWGERSPVNVPWFSYTPGEVTLSYLCFSPIFIFELEASVHVFQCDLPGHRGSILSPAFLPDIITALEAKGNF